MQQEAQKRREDRSRPRESVWRPYYEATSIAMVDDERGPLTGKRVRINHGTRQRWLPLLCLWLLVLWLMPGLLGVLGSVSGTTPIRTYCSYTQSWRSALSGYDGHGQLISRTDGRGFMPGSLRTTSRDPSLVPPTPQLDPTQAPLDTTAYTYTAQGDPQSVTSPPITTTVGPHVPVTTGYSEDADGNAALRVAPNGDQTYSQYDLADRPRESDVFASSGGAQPLLAQDLYAFDAADNPVGGASFNQYARASSFDGANRPLCAQACLQVCPSTPNVGTVPTFGTDGNVLPQPRCYRGWNGSCSRLPRGWTGCTAS